MKIIAIDGPAGSGKGTISSFLAEKLGFITIDTGLFYRYIGWTCLQDISAENDFEKLLLVAKNIQLDDLKSSILRQETVAQKASQLSVHQFLRDAMNDKIRQLTYSFATEYPGAIVDGRDVGSVIFPGADIKLFITADEEVRSKRRINEMGENKPENSISQRDERDMNRKASPLKKVEDAFLVDTTFLTILEAQKVVYELIQKNLK